MGSKILNTLTLILLSVAVYAQCTTTLSGPTLQFAPADGSSLPDAEVSQPYNATIEVFVPSQYTLNSTLVNVDFFKLIRFTGSPSLTYTPSTGNDTLPPGAHCIDVASSQIQHPVGTYTLKMVVQVRGVDTSGANFAALDTIVTYFMDIVYGTPVAEINVNAPTTICQDAQLTFSPNKAYSNASYTWSAPGATLVGAPAATSTFAFPTAGIFDVVLTATDAGTAYDTVSINVVANPSVTISALGFSASCGGSAVLAYNPSGSFKVDAPQPTISYQWYLNGSAVSGANDTTYTPAVASGVVTLVADDSISCRGVSNGYTLTDVVLVDIELCVVTVDSATGKNLLVWEKPAGATCVDSVKIWKESNVTGVYDLIATIDYNDYSTYLDATSTPDVKADKYRISLSDAGLVESQSAPHKSIHLTINQGQGNARNLIWNAYEGAPVATYNIYRGTSPTTLTLLASVSGSNTSYTDLNPMGSANVYQIEVVLPYACNPSKTGSAKTRSNVADDADITSISNDMLNNELTIAPNPASGLITINAGDLPVSSMHIMAIDGRQVLDVAEVETGTPTRIDISDLNPGIYLVNVKLTNGQFINRKLLVH